MGGREELFGPVEHDPNEPVFHQDWERRAAAIVLQVLAYLDNVDFWRGAMERLDRERYLFRYYGRWLHGTEQALIERGLLGADEVQARIEGRAPKTAPSRRVGRLRAGAIARALRFVSRKRSARVMRLYPRVFGYARRARFAPMFAIGDEVAVRSERGTGHTRLPGYICGKRGRIVVAHGAMIFPDVNARDDRVIPDHLYTVAFDGRALWGDGAEPGTVIHVDVFEQYLEPKR